MKCVSVCFYSFIFTNCFILDGDVVEPESSLRRWEQNGTVYHGPDTSSLQDIMHTHLHP